MLHIISLTVGSPKAANKFYCHSKGSLKASYAAFTTAQQVARNKLRATCSLKQHVARNTQLVACCMMLVARIKLRVARMV